MYSLGVVRSAQVHVGQAGLRGLGPRGVGEQA